MKLVQSTESIMATFGGRKTSPESTTTQSHAPQPSRFRKSSNFRLSASRLCGGTEGEGEGREADQNAVDLKVSGSLAFVGVQNKDVTATTMTTGSGYVDSTHKLIDLGTAVAVHDVGDEEGNDTLKTATEMEFAG
jgi:hypothetical protein